DEVAGEDGLSPFGVRRRARRGAVERPAVTQPLQQPLELDAAAVDIADHVEGPTVPAPVHGQRNPLEGCLARLNFVQDVHLAKALAAEFAKGADQLLALELDRPRANLAASPPRVAFHADPLGDVEDDGHDRAVV